MIELGGAAINPLDIELGLGHGEPYLCRFRQERRKLEGYGSDPSLVHKKNEPDPEKSIKPFLILLKVWSVMKTVRPAHFRKEYGEKKIN